MLKLKDRKNSPQLKKVLIYGNDGTGKSTFAEQYCHENGLKPVCIDIDDTNYTNVPIVDLDLGNDIKTYRGVKETIEEITKSDEFDTIILDGVTSMLELLVSKAKGLKKYSDRAERFQDIIRVLIKSKKHLIFIGQADMRVVYNEEHQSSKMVIKVNSFVNEKYLCYKKNDGFSHKIVKYRGVKNTPNKTSSESVNDIIGEIDDDPIRNHCRNIKKMLEDDGVNVTKSTMKSKVVKLINAGEIDPSLRPDLIKFIQNYCPEGV